MAARLNSQFQRNSLAITWRKKSNGSVGGKGVSARSKVSSRWQVVIPKEVRFILNVELGEYVRFKVENGKVVVEKEE